MALAPHSNFLCNHETIKCQVGSKLHSHTRFGWEYAVVWILEVCNYHHGGNKIFLLHIALTRMYLRGKSSILLLLFYYFMKECGDLALSSASSSFSLLTEVLYLGKYNMQIPEDAALMVWKKWGQLAKTAIVTLFILSVASKADAVDALKTCTCLLKECRIELAKCIANPACAANVACLQTCNNRPDETECQVSSISVQSPGKNVYLVNLMLVTFLYLIQVFPSKKGNKLVGNLTWRIGTPDGGFFTQSAVQKFVQDPKAEMVHGMDMAVLYFIQESQFCLKALYIPELQTAAQKVGRDFNTFIKTENTCGPEPPLVEHLEKKVEEGERTIIKEEEIEEEVEKVREKEVSLFSRLFEGFKELQQDEENFIRKLSKEEMDILDGLKMEATEVEKLFGNALPIRKL
ncbi:hypothetical protein H5410_022500, partial [Solanum commersonii]